ncbi:MAG: universal stress protein, partial [Cyclobacteriaceae bacterium]
ESEVIELNDVPHDEDRFLSYLTDAIYTETQTKDIDFIVMGTRSQHTVGERLLGSNSIDIIKTSEGPVMVIPENFHEFNPKIIGFASDFLQTQAWSLNMLKTLGHLYKAEVMVFHIADDIGADEQKQIDRIKENLSSLENFSIRIVAAESVIEGIKEFSASHHLDVLAMMPREHNLFERLFVKSVTKEIAIDIDIQLLTFRP